MNTYCVTRTHGAARWGGLLLAVAMLGAAPAPAGTGAVIYPSKGQSLEQQGKDEGECRGWAQQQTGFDPAQGPNYQPVASTGGEVVSGAARGALLGTVGGAIGGNAGKGAAIGAGVGATSGLLRKSRKQAANEAAQQQARADYDARLNQYNRAFGACMQGRGYAVN